MSCNKGTAGRCDISDDNLLAFDFRTETGFHLLEASVNSSRSLMPLVVE